MLGVLAVAFLAWAGVVWGASKQLAEKFDNMRKDFHAYSLSMERRITEMEGVLSRMESEIKSIEKGLKE